MAEAAAESTEEYGGYDYDFVDKLDSKFYCLVCQKVLRDPVLTGCCGQHYCDSCIQEWDRVNYDKKCPHCRKVNYSNLINKPLQREINSLKIYCINRSQGCRWSDKLTVLPRHLESEKDGCGYVEVECVLRCRENIKRGQLTKHLHHECPHRPYECGYCGKEDTYTKITGEERMTQQKVKIPEEKGHYAECQEYTKKCPNPRCGKIMKRKEISEHRKQCPGEPVECTFRGPNTENKTMTCNQKMLRSDLPNHQKICQFRTFECKFCGTASTYAAITGAKDTGPQARQPRIPPEQGHYTTCPDYPLFCKNKCQPTEIKRSNMEKHLTTCSLEKVPCPMREVGCQEMVCRKDLDKHMASNQTQHLAILCRAHAATKNELATVKTQLDSTSTNTELTAELETLKIRSAETERKLEESSMNTKRELAGVKRELTDVKRELIDVKRELTTVRRASVKTKEPAPPQREETQQRRKRFWRRKW